MTRAALANLDALDGDAQGVATLARVHAVLRRAFEELVEDPPWRALADAAGLVPWQVTPAAVDEARARGLRVWGAPPNVVARVRDPAFCARVARDNDLDPPLSGLPRALDPDELSTAEIEGVVAAWPTWARARFAVVDRSGVRLVPGRDGVFRFTNDEGLLVFRLRGGGVVLPSPAPLDETTSCWLVDEHGEPHLLGSAYAPQGEPRAALDGARPALLRRPDVEAARGGVLVTATGLGLGAGTAFDDGAVERARVVVEAAAAAGYRGPCAVDGFTWLAAPGEERLRGAAALRPRFTLSHLALGLVAASAPAPGGRFRVRARVRGGGGDDALVVEELPS